MIGLPSKFHKDKWQRDIARLAGLGSERVMAFAASEEMPDVRYWRLCAELGIVGASGEVDTAHMEELESLPEIHERFSPVTVPDAIRERYGLTEGKEYAMMNSWYKHNSPEVADLPAASNGCTRREFFGSLLTRVAPPQLRHDGHYHFELG